MAINLTKNRDSLKKTWQQVFDDTPDVNWAVFGYDGKTNDLKVAETGDGDLDELVDELNEGKMLYAAIKVMDPNTNLPKIVFINWQGEGVPSSRKGVCANHVRDVEKFFRGAHVTINARSSDDVEESIVLEKVKKASGANYSFHKEKAKPAEPIAPVGSVYQKVKIQKEIDVQQRDQFWSQSEENEKRRKEQERKQVIAEKNEAERKRKEREAKEAEAREKQYRERSRSIEEQKKKEKEAEEKKKEEERKRWEQQQIADEREMEQEKQRSNSLRQARLKEAESLIRQGQDEKPKFQERTGPPPAPTKARPPARKPPPQVQRHQPEPEPEPEPEVEPEPEPLPTEPEPEPEPEQEPEPEEPTDFYENVEMPDTRPDSTYDMPEQQLPEEKASYEAADDVPAEREAEPAADDDNLYDNMGMDTAPVQPQAPSGGQGKTAKALYDYQAENDEEITFDPGDIITEVDPFDEGWWRGRGPDGHFGMFPSNYVELIEGPSEVAHEPEPTPVVEEDRGLQARALYDYQASDDTEITFDPDDLITNIEQIDEGWWRGQAPDGSVGLFPANYVELIS